MSDASQPGSGLRLTPCVHRKYGSKRQGCRFYCRSGFQPLFHNSSRRAFILLETMIGVFVFAIGVLALAKCVDQCLTAEIAKTADQRARLALENRMAEIEAGAVAVSKPGSEELKGMFKGITLKQSRTPLRAKNELNKELVGLYVVNLEAAWKDSGLVQSKALSFYVLDQK